MEQQTAEERWAQRGRIILLGVFALMAVTYLLERLVYHAVIGPRGLGSSAVIVAVLIGCAALIYRGWGWLRWPVGLFFVVNGLGTPTGMAAIFGALAGPIALLQLGGHLACALALWFAPGIGAFLRAQRARLRQRRAAAAHEAAKLEQPEPQG